MMVYTDNRAYALRVLPRDALAALAPLRSAEPGLAPLLEDVFGELPAVVCTRLQAFPRGHLLISETSPRSQYDQLVGLARSTAGLPDRVFCLAGSGRDFHGFKGRSWASVPGNLHLAVHLSPDRPLERFQIAFTALAALSVVEALARVPDLKGQARIKWVNDILVDDAKVAGILAYTQSQADTVTSAVLGIGLNVEATPRVAPTPFVPRVASVRDFLPSEAPDARAGVLVELMTALDRNYDLLLQEGVSPLLDAYRARSMVIGREVTVCTQTSDQSIQVITEGVVSGLGDGLELLLEGRVEGIVSGRLAMGRATEQVRAWSRDAREEAPGHALSGSNACV